MVRDWAIPQRIFLHVNIILNVLMLLTQSLHVVIKIICVQVLSKDSARVLGFLAFGLQPLGLFHTKGLPWVPSGSVKSRSNLHLFYVEMVPSSISPASRWRWAMPSFLGGLKLQHPACCARECYLLQEQMWVKANKAMEKCSDILTAKEF